MLKSTRQLIFFVLLFVGYCRICPAATGITFDDYVRLIQMIKPSPAESVWSNIPWLTDLNEARRKAAAEGKPLIVWTMGGEPLGEC